MIEMFDGHAEVVLEDKVIQFPVVCKARDKKEAEKLLTRDIQRKLKVAKENIKLHLKRFSL
jgi:hypothetical protein